MRLLGYAIVVAIAATVAAQELSKNVQGPASQPKTAVVAQPAPAGGTPGVAVTQPPERQNARNPEVRKPLPLAAGPPGCYSDQTVTLQADRSGHFTTDVEINGRIIPMLVDTGASIVAIPHEVAIRVGLDLVNGKKGVSHTANGKAQITYARATQLRVGSICLYDVDVAVFPPGALDTGLLGMNVIRKMKRFELSETYLVMAR